MKERVGHNVDINTDKCEGILGESSGTAKANKVTITKQGHKVTVSVKSLRIAAATEAGVKNCFNTTATTSATSVKLHSNS